VSPLNETCFRLLRSLTILRFSLTNGLLTGPNLRHNHRPSKTKIPIMKVPFTSRFFCLFAIIALSGAPSAFSQSTVVQQTYPGLSINGTAGNPFLIEYVTDLANTNSWLTLTNFVLPTSPYLFIDLSAPGASKRFYRETNSSFTVRSYVGLTITGNTGSTNLIQYVDTLGNTNNWTTLTNIVLPTSPHFFVDSISPAGVFRRYRAEDVAQPPRVTLDNSVLAQVGIPFNYQISATSYLPITSYDATGLPAGLNVNTLTGVISGSPSVEGTNLVSLIARNSTGSGSNTLTLNLRVSLATPLVSIAAGTFTMGSAASDPDSVTNDQPQTQVTIAHAFLIGKYEVNQGEYQAITGSNPSFFTGDLSRPVESVSWEDATNFCALLTARDRQSAHISGTAFYRLPTEAEWEYAARAGTSTAYSFGDDASSLGQYAWFDGDSAQTSHPIGQKLPNPWGLYDMHGNTWELCMDWFGPYPGGAVTDPQGPVTGTRRIVRGGSWFRASVSSRSARRATLPSNSRNGDGGFRIVLVSP